MFEEKIFIPSSAKTTFDSYSCHIINDNGVIVSYNTNITCNNDLCTIPFFKVYSNNHYLVQYEDKTISQTDYNDLISTCSYSNYSDFTDNVFYRFDMSDILVMFIIFLLIMFYFPYRILARMFGRWFKW